MTQTRIYELAVDQIETIRHDSDDEIRFTRDA